SRRGCVLTDAQACFRGSLEKYIAYNHSQRSFARHAADPFGERDDFAEPCPAAVATEQMLLHRFLFSTRQNRQPIIGEDGRVDGIGAVHGVCVFSGDHTVAPMHSRSWWTARWRI